VPVATVSVVLLQRGVAAVPFSDTPPMVEMVVDAHVSGEMVVVDPLQFPAGESVTVGDAQPVPFHAQLHALQSRVSLAVSTNALHDDVKPSGHAEMQVGGTLPEYDCTMHVEYGAPLDSTHVA
jgi:hypothetical protein